MQVTVSFTIADKLLTILTLCTNYNLPSEYVDSLALAILHWLKETDRKQHHKKDNAKYIAWSQTYLNTESYEHFACS